MHEILFRAKRLDNGEWVEGYYQKRKDAFENDEHIIFRCESCHTWEYVEVDPETLCQYTGLTDKNGNKIWENDVLRFEWDKKKIVDVIKYDPPMFTYSNSVRWNLCKDEVIGNIFDTPEFLKNE